MAERRMRLLAIALVCAGVPGLVVASARAGDGCGCRHRIVLNGMLDTAAFDGGVGDRFGGDGDMSGATIVYGGASAGGFAGSGASASAAAQASAHAFAGISTPFHGGGFHGVMGHGGGGMHGGYGGHH